MIGIECFSHPVPTETWHSRNLAQRYGLPSTLGEDASFNVIQIQMQVLHFDANIKAIVDW